MLAWFSQNMARWRSRSIYANSDQWEIDNSAPPGKPSQYFTIRSIEINSTEAYGINKICARQIMGLLNLFTWIISR